MHAPFDPSADLERLHREFAHVARATRRDAPRRAQPAVDVFQRDAEVVVLVALELATMKPLQVRVHIDGRRVTLSGRGACGAFRRTFTLPTAVDPTRGEAKLEDGLLTLRLPLLES